MVRVVLAMALVLAACKKSGDAPPSPLQDASVKKVAIDAAIASDAAAAVKEAAVPTKIVVGAHAACALLSDSTVRCWGKNELGQLGDGTQTDSTKPVMPKLTGVKDLVMGEAHACALLSDTSVTCWGKIGYGPQAHLNEPLAAPGVRDIVRIFAVGGASCGTEKGGALVCWGDVDARGHVTTTGAHHAPTPVPGVDHVTALVARAALREDGDVSLWLDDGAPVRAGVTKMKELAQHDDLVCALDDQGTTTCFGPSRCAAAKPAGKPAKPKPAAKPKPKPKKGKKPTKPAKPEPEPAKTAEAKVVSYTLPLPKAAHLAFETGACVVTTAKQLICADLPHRCAPVRPWPAMVTVEAMSGACALLANGSVRCGVTGSPVAPVIAGMPAATQLSATAPRGCAIAKDQTLACWEGTAAAHALTWTP